MDATALGYAPDFLPVAVPLPTPAADRVVRELPYTHFTVLLDPLRRLAAATAVNIDGSALQEVDRADDWRLDSRVPASEQAGDELYAANDLDRGHLVRRRDPVWGDRRVAEQANNDTFVFTNAAPQAADFNQSKELWLGLEDHVLDHARAAQARISVFTGPVLDPTDPVYRGIAIPGQFWKIAAWVDEAAPSDEAGDSDSAPNPGTGEPAGILAATGYLLDQTPLLDDIDLSEAKSLAAALGNPPPLGPFRTFQVPIADIATLTGLVIGDLVSADRLPATASAGPPAAGSRLGWVRLRSGDDIVL